MAFAIPLAMIATAAGTGISMIGQAQAAKATEAQDLSQAQYRTALGNIYQTRAQQQMAAGYQRAEDVGLQYGARAARQRVFGGAGNIAGPSLQNTIASTLALGQLSQRRTIATAGEAAFQEQLRGTEETYTAGLETRAAENVAAALPLQEAGIAASGLGKIAGMGMEASQLGGPSAVGGSQPVSSKWYSGLDMGTDTGPTTGEPLNLLG
jgi:hypothetical protein